MATRTAKGTFNSKAPTTSYTALTSVAVTSGAALFVLISERSGTDGSPSAVTWNGTGLTKLREQQAGVTASWSSIWMLANATGGTGNVVITHPTTAPDGIAGCAIQWEGLDAAPFDKTASASSQDSGATATTAQANEVLIGITGAQGQEVAIGTNTGDCSTEGQAFTTTGGGSPATQAMGQESYATVTSTGTYRNAHTGAYGSNNTAIIVTLKEAAAGDITESPGVGSVVITGLAPSLILAITTAVGAGAVTISGFAPTVQVGSRIESSSGSVVATGFAPTVTATNNHLIAPGPGQVTATGLAPTVLSGLAAQPGAGSVAITGLAPSLRFDLVVQPGAGSVTATGQIPTVTVSGGTTITPSVGSVAISGFVPTVFTPQPGIATLTSTTIELFLNSAWVDVTTDVVGPEVFIHYGSWGSGPLDKVAHTGYCRFSLDNSAANSAGLLGYYSPGHTNARAGFMRGVTCRVILSYLGASYTKFYGKAFSIDPEPGQRLGRKTHVVAYDWLNDLAEFVVREVTAQSSQRADQLLTTLIAAMPTASQPLSTSFDTGIDTFPLAFDDLGDGANGLSVAAAVVLSEFGWLYQKGDGTVRFENRQTLQGKNSAATFDDTMTDLTRPGSLASVFNHVRATIHPKDTGGSTVVLWAKATDVVPSVPGSGSLTIFGKYRDPNDESVPVGGTSMVTPVASTDYVANTQAGGGGTDITSDITITASFYGSSFKYVITNANVSTAFLTTLQARGLPIFDLTPITLESESTQSYGRRTLELDMPYQDDEAVAFDLITYLRAQYEGIEGQVETVGFQARRSHEHMAAALTLEPGEVITISETVTGADEALARIAGVELTVQGTYSLWCRFATTPAFITDAFILDSADFGELDDDMLGYL